MVRILVLIIFASCLFAESDLPANSALDDPGIIHGKCRVGKLVRTWDRFTPAHHDYRAPCMLVIALHGGAGQEAMAGLTEHGFEACAERDDGIILYPNGIEHNWNDDRKDVESTAHRNQIDDVAFISEMINATKNDTPIDSKKIFVTGISNGAMMCYRLARELPGTFAAIAPVAGSLPVGADAKPWPEPVSAILIFGSRDPLMPFEGGIVGTSRIPRGEVLSAPDTVRFIVDQDHLKSPGTKIDLVDTDPQDGTKWKGEAFGDANGGIAVAMFVIEGGGHTWPGGRQYLPERIVGKTSRDRSACELIWNFFQHHPHP